METASPIREHQVQASPRAGGTPRPRRHRTHLGGLLEHGGRLARRPRHRGRHQAGSRDHIGRLSAVLSRRHQSLDLVEQALLVRKGRNALRISVIVDRGEVAGVLPRFTIRKHQRHAAESAAGRAHRRDPRGRSHGADARATSGSPATSASIGDYGFPQAVPPLSRESSLMTPARRRAHRRARRSDCRARVSSAEEVEFWRDAGHLLLRAVRLRGTRDRRARARPQGDRRAVQQRRPRAADRRGRPGRDRDRERPPVSAAPPEGRRARPHARVQREHPRVARRRPGGVRRRRARSSAGTARSRASTA